MSFYKIIFSNILIVLISYFVYKSYFGLNILNITDIDKCPFCYGRSICTDIFNGNIQLNSTSSNIIYNLINLFFNSKNIYYGTYKLFNEDRSQFLVKDIIVKKLASHDELDKFDNLIRTEYGVQNNFQQIDEKQIHNFFRSLSNEGEVKLKLCPDQNNIDVVYDRRGLTSEDHVNLDTTLVINPEPLIMQILNASEGWPVPVFYGTCGRLVIFENCGTRLSSLLNTDWCDRAKLVKDIVHMAYNLTYSHKRVSVYLTDVSVDNLVVSDEGVLKIVDLEHTIIVDRHPITTDLPESWFIPHKSEHHDCDKCFSYSADDVCSHRISDHNFYAVCKEVLSNETSISHDWILHSPPPHLQSEAYLLSSLIDTCVDPPPDVLRKNVAQQIVQTITSFLTQKC